MFSPSLKAVHVGHLDAELAFALLKIAQQVVEAPQQVLAAGLGGFAQHFGVGEQEVRRAHRVDELPRIEIHLLRGLRVQPVDLLHHILHVTCRQQIRLLDEVEDLILAPGVVLEAPIRGRRVDHRLGLRAHDAARGVLPEGHVVLPEAELCGDQSGGVGDQPGGHFHEGTGDVQRVRRVLLVRLALQPFADDALRALGDVGHRTTDLRRVGQLEPRGFGLGLVGHTRPFRRHHHQLHHGTAWSGFDDAEQRKWRAT